MCVCVCAARTQTAFVYLSDVPPASGGETAFTKLLDAGVPPVEPKLGRLLVWPNVWTDEPSIADRRMYHEARELRRGIKYGANIWVRLTRNRNRFGGAAEKHRAAGSERAGGRKDEKDRRKHQRATDHTRTLVHIPDTPPEHVSSKN